MLEQERFAKRWNFSVSDSVCKSKESYDCFSTVVHLVRDVLATGTAGVGAVSHRVAIPVAFPDRWDRGAWSAGVGVDDRDATGAVVENAVSGVAV